MLDEGKTVILDLSNAHPTVLTHYSKKLSHEVFQHQQNKFVEDNLTKSGTKELRLGNNIPGIFYSHNSRESIPFYIKEDKILVRSYYAINLYKKGFKNMVIFTSC